MENLASAAPELRDHYITCYGTRNSRGPGQDTESALTLAATL